MAASEDYMQAGDSGEASSKSEPSDSPDSGEDMQETALVPKSMLKAGVKPGDTCMVEVVSVHGDEAEVKWVKDEESGETKPDAETGPDEAHASIDRGVAKMAGMGM